MKIRERIINRESEVKAAFNSLRNEGFYAATLDEIYKETLGKREVSHTWDSMQPVVGDSML